MRVLASQARARGLTFDEFWEAVVRPGMPIVATTTPSGKRPVAPCVLWPSDSLEARTWLDATLDARDGWRRAYELMEPLPRERALIRLRPLLRRMELAA